MVEVIPGVDGLYLVRSAGKAIHEGKQKQYLPRGVSRVFGLRQRCCCVGAVVMEWSLLKGYHGTHPWQFILK